MIDIALKEWATVCDLLIEGRTCLLLRKGGVHESGGPGRFKLEHDRFALFPASEHERLDWIKPEHRLRESPIETEPSELSIRGWAEVAGIWKIPSRDRFDELEDLHVWRAPQIDMRFDYKPDRPLYAMALRVRRFEQPHVLPNRAAFAGCRSWVPLEGQDAIAPRPATAAMSQAQLTDILKRVNTALSGDGSV